MAEKITRTVESKCPRCGSVVICTIINGKIVNKKIKDSESSKC